MSETMCTFNTLYECKELYPSTEEDYEIAGKMSAYRANSVKTLDPNRGDSYDSGDGEKLPHWEPKFSYAKHVAMKLEDAFEPVGVASREMVEFVMEYSPPANAVLNTVSILGFFESSPWAIDFWVGPELAVGEDIQREDGKFDDSGMHRI
ncbi:hypothetical protein BJY01DRAFT_251813 [Aspergillus pseudoustus]|uniref:Uncharacterized protein n=1 Tax=Aspergillus pseudoustus TaxID=1810923 RepID=A0ABR4J9Y4_9EURO